VSVCAGAWCGARGVRILRDPAVRAAGRRAAGADIPVRHRRPQGQAPRHRAADQVRRVRGPPGKGEKCFCREQLLFPAKLLITLKFLLEKLEKAEWEPDYGPRQFVAQWGASMVGVRPFLLAYNVNILGTKEQAHR
jgi:hypothetical protein